jgi:hypothetical protein
MPPPERACAAHNAVTRLEVVDDAALIARIERCFSEVRSVAMETHDKIGYTNIFHAAWSDEANARYAPVLEGILDRINAREGGRLAARDVLNAGFIYAAPNNQRQTFHYDYGNTTDTYFLPLVELSDRNGTELLRFHDAAHYETYFPILDAINNRYTSADDVRAHLARHGVPSSAYAFVVFSAAAYTLYKLPRFVFHRGKTNETGAARVMFQLAAMHDRSYARHVAADESVPDAELDDARDRAASAP